MRNTQNLHQKLRHIKAFFGRSFKEEKHASVKFNNFRIFPVGQMAAEQWLCPFDSYHQAVKCFMLVFIVVKAIIRILLLQVIALATHHFYSLFFHGKLNERTCLR